MGQSLSDHTPKVVFILDLDLCGPLDHRLPERILQDVERRILPGQEIRDRTAQQLVKGQVDLPILDSGFIREQILGQHWIHALERVRLARAGLSVGQEGADSAGEAQGDQGPAHGVVDGVGALGAAESVVHGELKDEKKGYVSGRCTCIVIEAPQLPYPLYMLGITVSGL